MARGSGWGMSILVFDGIGRVLDVAAVTMAARVREAAEEGAQELESYAQMNAPWTDRTGDARSGLTAEVFTEGLDVVIELAHSVDYGIWLEIKNDGEYAIIMPTLEALGPEILERMGAGTIELEGVS